jgi:hypothetical protein
MTFQPINLGTPNNNDGDSLYTGGTKINANFTELYVGLAGSSSAALKIDVAGGAGAVTSTVLGWSSGHQEYIPTKPDSIRTSGAVSENSLFITDNSGISGGADTSLTSIANTLVSRLDGRNMFLLRAMRNTSTATTRGSFELTLGNTNVTSLSVFTTSVVVRGLNGLEAYKASGEDTAVYTPLLLSPTTSTGITLYQTPSLDLSTISSGVRTGSDSSLAIAHTGFVKINLDNYVQSSTVIRGQRGIIGTWGPGSLVSNTTIVIDGVYHPKHIEGLIYNYNTIDNKITLVTGAACHWSYNTSGVAGIIPTTAIAVVASYNPIIRTFTSGWTPQYNTAGTIPAVIDGSISANTWYYLYYIGCLVYTSSFGTGVGNEFWPGSSNVIVSSNRDIASVDAQLAAAGYGGVWQTVRRLGPVRSNASGSGLVPFNVKRIDHGGFEYYWGLQPNASGDTSYTLTINTASSLKVVGSSAIFTLQDYNSSVITAVPPIPGITAHFTVRHLTPSNSTLPQVYMYGDSWTVNSSISALFPPFEVFRSTTTGITCLHNIQVPMSPDGCYVPDGTYGGAGLLAITTSTGQRLRWIMQNTANEGAKPLVTSTLMQITTTGFRLAR